MARFTRIEVANKMGDTGIVPLFYHSDIETSKRILKACFDGGVRVVEFTNRGEFAHEVFASLSKYALNELPELALGIGSVTDAGAASLYMQLGANFIVTPVFRGDIAQICNRRKVLWLPGCGSLNEIAKAEEAGCEIVKLFPGGIYGPDFVKAVKAPQPWTNIMPTGGVKPTKESLIDWFEAGVHCVGIGSELITKEIVANGDYDLLEQGVRKAINIIKESKR